MRNLRDIVTERLRISKNMKTDNITLSLWVRWYNSGNDRCIDEDEVTSQNIVDALSGNSNKKLSSIQLVEFYEKHKNYYLEDFKEEKQPTQTFPNGCIVNFNVDYLSFTYELVESFEDFIKTNKMVYERLSISKALSQKTITLETFVRWCESDINEIKKCKLTDKTLTDEDIYGNLNCRSARIRGLESEDDYVEFFQKHKNDTLEKLRQVDADDTYLNFEVGGIYFEIEIWGSFWIDMNNIFDINIEHKYLQQS